MKKRLLGALQFLTIIPIGGNAAAPGESAVFFPVTGALLGASAGALLWTFGGGSLAALLALIYLITVTGCLHEDGLADIADAVRAGRSQEKIFAILKDSRIGTYGAVALILSIIARWQALALCRINPIYGMAAALGLSRTALVILAATTQPVGIGLGRSFTSTISRAALLAAVGQSMAIAFATGWCQGIAMLLATSAVIALARIWFLRRLGGVNGDCLGATCQVVETINLLLLTWRPSF
jgi:adenosylcobinamide-GDP ribazoletransferase